MGEQACIHIVGLADIHTACLFAKNRIDVKHILSANGAEPCLAEI